MLVCAHAGLPRGERLSGKMAMDSIAALTPLVLGETWEVPSVDSSQSPLDSLFTEVF